MRPLKRMAGGGVVDKPSLYDRIGDFLFGNKALKQAAQGGPTPPATAPKYDQDISYVRKAAEEAAERMKKEKEGKMPAPGQAPKPFKRGGIAKPGCYGR